MIQRHIILGNAALGLGDGAQPFNEGKIMAAQGEGGPNSGYWPTLREVRHQAAVKVESEVISKALEVSRWNRRKTAELLQISYKALLYKMKGCGIRQQQVFNY